MSFLKYFSFSITKKKAFFWLILILLATSLFTTVYVTLSQYAEEHYWDTLYYQKSGKYGYAPNMLHLIQQRNSWSVEHRLKDLRALINAEHKNSKRPKLELQPNTYKVVIIGDSMVYGEGVKEEERFGAVLEEKLNKARPTQVFILAHPGDNILDNYSKFLLAEKHIQPDLYIFGLVINDLLLDLTDKYPGESDLYRQLQAACPTPEFKNPYDPKIGWDDLVFNYYSKTFSDEYANKCYLKTIADELNKDKNKVMGLLFFEQDTDQYVPMEDVQKVELELMGIYKTVFASSGAKVVTPDDLEVFDFIPVSKREGHPSKATHQSFAQLLFNEIVRNEQLKF